MILTFHYPPPPPPTFARDDYTLPVLRTGLPDFCMSILISVNSLSIKAVCIEGNSDSHNNFIDKVKMDRLLRPEKLDADPSSSTASKDWLHWLRTFENFLTVLPLPMEGLDRLLVLTNYVSPRIFEYIEHCFV